MRLGTEVTTTVQSRVKMVSRKQHVSSAEVTQEDGYQKEKKHENNKNFERKRNGVVITICEDGDLVIWGALSMRMHRSVLYG